MPEQYITLPIKLFYTGVGDYSPNPDAPNIPPSFKAHGHELSKTSYLNDFAYEFRIYQDFLDGIKITYSVDAGNGYSRDYIVTQNSFVTTGHSISLSPDSLTPPIGGTDYDWIYNSPGNPGAGGTVRPFVDGYVTIPSERENFTYFVTATGHQFQPANGGRFGGPKYLGKVSSPYGELRVTRPHKYSRLFQFVGEAYGSSYQTDSRGGRGYANVSSVEVFINGVVYEPQITQGAVYAEWQLDYTVPESVTARDFLRFRVIDQYGARSSWASFTIPPVAIFTVTTEDNVIFHVDGSPSYSLTSEVQNYQWNSKTVDPAYDGTDYQGTPVESTVGGRTLTLQDNGVKATFDFTEFAERLDSAQEVDSELHLYYWKTGEYETGISGYSNSYFSQNAYENVVIHGIGSDRLHAAYTPHGETFTARKNKDPLTVINGVAFDVPGIIVYRTPKGAPGMIAISYVSNVKNPSMYCDAAGILHLTAQNRSLLKWHVFTSYDGGENFTMIADSPFDTNYTGVVPCQYLDNSWHALAGLKKGTREIWFTLYDGATWSAPTQTVTSQGVAITLPDGRSKALAFFQEHAAGSSRLRLTNSDGLDMASENYGETWENA